MFLPLSFLGHFASANQDGLDMVCTYTKPQDMRNVEVLYSQEGSGRSSLYCTTKATTTQGAPLLTAASGSVPKVFPYCDYSTLPYIPGNGYNILIGMPLATGENALDKGYLNTPVFNLTNTHCRNTQPQPGTGYWDFSIPDVYHFESLSTLTAGKAMETTHGEKSFQEQAKKSLSVAGGGKAFGVGVEFTAGADWESATSSLSEGNTVQQRFHREATAYQTTLPLSDDLHLADTYLERLTDAYMNNAWSTFFFSYGTHVTTQIITGARYTQVSMFTREKFEEISSNKVAYNAGIKASYEGATGSTKVETETEKSNREMVESSAFNQYIVSIGGNGAAMNSTSFDTLKQYQIAAHNYPAPLYTSLLSHEELITQAKWSEFRSALTTRFPGLQKAESATMEQFSSAWVAAINAYCLEDAHKCLQASSSAPPEEMTLTDFNYDSPHYGQADGGSVIGFNDMPDFQQMKPLVRISAIRTFCSKVSYGRSRVRGIQFEFFDGDRSEATHILGIQGDTTDPQAGQPWKSKDNLIKFGEVISSVQVSSGADVDGIWFIVQNLKSSETRKVGCGYNSQNTQVWNIESGRRLLAFAGVSQNMDGYPIVKQIQFRSFLYILPTVTPSGVPECKCVTPQWGQNGFITTFNYGAACTNGNFHRCKWGTWCKSTDWVPEDQFKCPSILATRQLEKSSVDHQVLLQQTEDLKAARPVKAPTAAAAANGPKARSAAPPTAPKANSVDHQVLLQQIEDLKATRQVKAPTDAAAAANGPKARSAAPPTAPKAKWDEAKQVVNEMAKTLKREVKAEIKDFAKELIKSSLGELQTKQSHLERTVTRMLMLEIESL